MESAEFWAERTAAILAEAHAAKVAIVKEAKAEAASIVSEAEAKAAEIVAAGQAERDKMADRARQMKAYFNRVQDDKRTEINGSMKAAEESLLKSIRIRCGMEPNPLEGKMVSEAAIKREVGNLIEQMKDEAARWAAGEDFLLTCREVQQRGSARAMEAA